ncbi:Tyrosine-protein kinase [Aphelenchoides fujianensis]|nr:Tyrosine-protein kinase [Aphelenchoides fujianensis]
MADEEQPPPPLEGQSSDPPPPDAQPDGQPEDEQQAPVPDDAPPPPPQGAADFLARTGLLDVPWYHGMLPFEDISRMLKENGNFLLRMEADESGEFHLVVSVFWEGLVKNYSIPLLDGGQFTFDHTVVKPSVKELIVHYQTAQRPLQPGGAQLVFPVRRQAWELRRADITQEQKLGEGAFGPRPSAGWAPR